MGGLIDDNKYTKKSWSNYWF